MVRPACCPMLGLLSSVSSARAQEMQLLMPSSQVQAQGVQVTRQEEPHHRRSPDLKMSVVQKTLRSSLCQQFFPATSPHQWQKIQYNTHPWQTPVSIMNQELSDCDARTQLTELLYRALIKLTILSGILSLVNNNQSEDRLSESKAACKST